MLLSPAEACGVFSGIYFVYGHMVMSLSVFTCVSHELCLCRQASGPLVSLIEFMVQQALYPTLSGSLVIELNYHFDTCRKSTKSHGCSDYFAGTLHVMTSIADRLPRLVHHTDRSQQTVSMLQCESLVTCVVSHITVILNSMKYFTLSDVSHQLRKMFKVPLFPNKMKWKIHSSLLFTCYRVFEYMSDNDTITISM